MLLTQVFIVKNHSRCSTVHSILNNLKKRKKILASMIHQVHFRFLITNLIKTSFTEILSENKIDFGWNLEKVHSLCTMITINLLEKFSHQLLNLTHFLKLI
jgi:hypothetical protein